MRHTTMHDYAGQVLCPRCGADTDGDTWPCCADGHDCSETCAKKCHSEEVCDKCEQELNTQLPTSGELSGKSKWEVFRRVPVRFGTMPDCPWRAVDEKTRETATFPTWREAMDYADRMARTREVVLPRVGYGDHVVAGKGVYSLHVEYVKQMTSIYLGGWDGAHIPNSQLWGLAMYLAACATHWEAHQ